MFFLVLELKFDGWRLVKPEALHARGHGGLDAGRLVVGACQGQHKPTNKLAAETCVAV
jgi:hypothetical protein